MPRYLYELAYTPQSWATQVAKPANRIEQVTPAITELGGKVVDAYYAFGEYDLIVILDMPSNEAMAAFALAVAAGGAVARARTTPLMTIDEGISALRKAGKSKYRPAGTRAASQRK